jgi:hypothetical protein
LLSVQGQGAAGTLHWMPPEFLKMGGKKKASTASDVYSLGVVLWEILTGQVPFDGDDETTIREAIKTGELLDIPAQLPASVKSLLRQCWALTPSDRPTCEAIILALKKIERDVINEETLAKSAHAQQQKFPHVACASAIAVSVASSPTAPPSSHAVLRSIDLSAVCAAQAAPIPVRPHGSHALRFMESRHGGGCEEDNGVGESALEASAAAIGRSKTFPSVPLYEAQVQIASMLPITARASMMNSMQQQLQSLQTQSGEEYGEFKARAEMMLMEKESDNAHLEERLRYEQDAHLALRSSVDRVQAQMRAEIEQRDHLLALRAAELKDREAYIVKEITERDAYIAAISARCNVAEAKLLELNAQIESDKTDLDAANEQYAKMVGLYDLVVASEKELRASVEQLQVELDQAQEDAEQLNQEAELRHKQAAEKAAVELAALRLELAQAQSERAGATSAEQERILRAATAQHLSDMSDLESRLRGEQDAHLALRGQMDKRDSEHKKAMVEALQRVSAAENETNELRQQVGHVRDTLQGQLDEMRAAYDELQRSLANDEATAPLVPLWARMSSLLGEKAQLEADWRAQVLEMANALAANQQQNDELLQLRLLVANMGGVGGEEAKAAVEAQLAGVADVRELEARLQAAQQAHLLQLASRDEELAQSTARESDLAQQLSDSEADRALAKAQYRKVVALYDEVVEAEEALKGQLADAAAATRQAVAQAEQAAAQAEQARAEREQLSERRKLDNRAAKLEAEKQALAVQKLRAESRRLAVKLTVFMKKWEEEHESRAQLQLSAGMPVESPEVSPVSSRTHSPSSRRRVSQTPSPFSSSPPSMGNLMSSPLSGEALAWTVAGGSDSARQSQHLSFGSISGVPELASMVAPIGATASHPASRGVSPVANAPLIHAPSPLPALTSLPTRGPFSSFVPAFLRNMYSSRGNAPVATPQRTKKSEQ